MIGHALSKIRFLTLIPSEFAACSAIQELLTQDEAYALLMKISSPTTVVTIPDGFSISTVSRANSTQPTSPEPAIFCCERTIVQQIPIQNYEQMDSYVTFTVSENITIFGIMVRNLRTVQLWNKGQRNLISLLFEKGVIMSTLIVRETKNVQTVHIYIFTVWEESICHDVFF